MTYLYAMAVLSGLGGALAVLLVIADRYLARYGPREITLNDEEPFVVEGGCTLLDALYRRKIFIPSGCGGQGTCGYCKVTVLAGGGPVLPTELPYLTRDEIVAGVRLACQLKVKQDLVLRVRPDFLHVREFRAVVSAARMVTQDTREIRLELVEPDTIDFRAGQYVQVRVPADGEDTFRAYSLGSAPGRAGDIELLVRLVPGGLGSTYLHRVERGDDVAFTGPYGEFILDEDPETELVCVAGGCGLAPIRSILRHVRETSPARPCWLFVGARTADDVMYLDEFEALTGEMPNLRVHYALSGARRGTRWTGDTGFIHDCVAARLPARGRRQAFLCGPPQMVEATMHVLDEKALARDRMFYDEF